MRTDCVEFTLFTVSQAKHNARVIASQPRNFPILPYKSTLYYLLYQKASRNGLVIEDLQASRLSTAAEGSLSRAMLKKHQNLRNKEALEFFVAYN